MAGSDVALRRGRGSNAVATEGCRSYGLDIAELRSETMPAFLTIRLPDAAVFPTQALGRIVDLMKRRGLTTRAAGACVARYLRDRAAYEGASFSLDESILQRALDVAA